MPLYDYKCFKCGKTFEKKVPMSDYKAPQICPECGAEAEKQISCAVLKGVG